MAKVTDGTKVAIVHATKKGEKAKIAGTKEIGGKGVDGRKRYAIYKQAVGRWTCTCLSYRFKKGEIGKKAPCKHMLKLWTDWKAGSLDSADFEILDVEAMS